MPANALKKLIHEPLLQFLLLGGLLFGLSQWLADDANDPKNIVIDDARVADLVSIFTEGQGREPSAEEVRRMVIKWAQNEIFYREALTMGLDRGDEMIRSRMVLKLRNVLFSSAMVADPSEREINQYFTLNRAAYDKPARYDFEQLALSEQLLSSAGNAQTLAQQIGSETPAAGRILQFAARPASNLDSLLGAANMQRMLAAPANQWQALEVDGRDLLVRITRVYPAEEVTIEQVRASVVRDWRKLAGDYNLAQQAQDIAQKYSVRFVLSEPMYEAFDAEDAVFDAPEALLGTKLSEARTTPQGAAQ